jgi:hypothetical protein
MIYDRPGSDESVTQGDIFDDCPLLFWDVEGLDKPAATEISTRVVVLTQACDMALGKATQILIAVVHAAHHLVATGAITAKLVRDQVRTHRVYGWYFLPAGGAMKESIVDLRNLHTIPRIMLDQLTRNGKRVCRITTPYREHLAQHFSTTYARIGLPEPYPSQPE